MTMIKRLLPLLLLGWMACAFSQNSTSQDSTSQNTDRAALEIELESLKDDTLQLNRDLLILEEDLLYPASSQLAVYLSMDLGEFFHLDSVRLHVDGDLVASQLYTDQQREALHRGGVQRLYLGNLSSGAHSVSAFFTGQGPRGEQYKRATQRPLKKSQEPVVLELRIVDSGAKLEPRFSIKEWSLQ